MGSGYSGKDDDHRDDYERQRLMRDSVKEEAGEMIADMEQWLEDLEQDVREGLVRGVCGPVTPRCILLDVAEVGVHLVKAGVLGVVVCLGKLRWEGRNINGRAK